ncbi:MAG: TIGR04372 family glycosyltransferase [Rhodospirillaceae bacterium]|jgi:putative glycosyltransferase (TIGR04372 family)|nr:TIGR04372 family glycosyltransferase [Rhodospirillaceae bacterium]MBT5245555.1 TIGR04372 family glycosyltransferase [Rhodospirillaceae bacterium]MBT5561037.1 TIGR04372 family glycosyltransferase [Rhodospirillaceae bacterium]MBT6240673.1 TIGR04372 family glycosyltransferase [Rhodospirillaceae bacterium]
MAIEDTNISSALDIVSFLEQNNGKLIINVAVDAVGHTLAEFDNYARMRLTGELDPEGTHLYMGPDEERAKTIASLYGEALFPLIFLSPLAPEMVRSIALFRPDLTVDVGISSSKVAPMAGKTEIVEVSSDGYTSYRTSIQGLLDDTTAYYRRKLATQDQNPLHRQLPLIEELEDFIDAKGKPLALIQIKDEESSASPEASNAETYMPALEYLKDQGYHLVQVGREHHPQIFSKFGVVDYANCPLASFTNDFCLFSNASVCLFGPSGVSYFAEIMEKPFVLTNSWWIPAAPFSAKAVIIPALAKSRSDGELINFRDQLNLQLNSSVYFPIEEYEIVNPDADDILAAMKECLELDKKTQPLNESQQDFKKLAANTPSGLSLSRVSADFLERYKQLL